MKNWNYKEKKIKSWHAHDENIKSNDEREKEKLRRGCRTAVFVFIISRRERKNNKMSESKGKSEISFLKNCEGGFGKREREKKTNL